MAPEPLQKIILEHCHDKPGSGHMGINKTTERVKRYAIWYKMLDSCLVYVYFLLLGEHWKIYVSKVKEHKLY